MFSKFIIIKTTYDYKRYALNAYNVSTLSKGLRKIINARRSSYIERHGFVAWYDYTHEFVHDVFLCFESSRTP
ncbi:hypothetical protein [Vibrio parahaemolyticus]|uniref:hypothetical protein n=1 Tax=Vibrio parahaemolyticus TaxID=670 RepID=UPI001F3996EB|nr:hypothetical protein [Vibrio parahaemolyticus]EJM7154349.1 hypothetical protein [Vibrio parahaemolyticus]UJX31239.1 hypothetical protein JHS79_21355 [Vibrio parahaemolyticus]UJX31247.1 hypothetical protein JHS79_21405 [Vibrio parahaemolyticus]UJX31255.1 hypothetical protein JHS79_21455 [Vibrio parahaemolyticus]UJX31262.1 hypothetical protein JHS79_21505 [Vibrio parahaemolyticus]